MGYLVLFGCSILLGKKMFRPNKLFVITSVPDFCMLFELILLVCTICTLKGHCYFACSKFSRKSHVLSEIRHISTRPALMWRRTWRIGPRHRKLNWPRSVGASHLGCHRVVAFLMPWFFVSAFLFFCSGNFRWRCFEICRFITYIYIYVLYQIYIYIYWGLLRMQWDTVLLIFQICLVYMYALHMILWAQQFVYEMYTTFTISEVSTFSSICVCIPP